MKIFTLKNTNKILTLLLFVGISFLVFAQEQRQPVSEFLGANTNIAAHDNKYLDKISSCVKWIREYHSWAHYEAANDYYKWDNITKEPHTYTWPNHNNFMDECTELGINVLIDALNKPGWLDDDHIPNNIGDGSKASDYIEKLEFMGQLVARYGSKQIEESKLESGDKATGLDIIKYYEDENEPDYWWWSPEWPAEDYATFCNAVHDGYGVETDAAHPLLGVKSVDPDAQHVVAGTAGADSLIFHEILQHSNGRIPFDVLNVHMYCSDHTNGYSPEHETYGFEHEMQGLFKWKNRVLPDMPIWITEFGWDTYKAKSGSHSYIYATFDAQANYLVRANLILMKMGFEKAFMFIAADVNSTNAGQYSSSGFIKDGNAGFEKKPSYFHLATMQNVLGASYYEGVVSYAKKVGNNEVYCLQFDDPDNNGKKYALWTRQTNSNQDNGATTEYQLDIGSASTVYSIVPSNFDEDGDTVSVTLDGKKVNLTLSERPIYIVASDIETGFEDFNSAKIDLVVYPNPTQTSAQILAKLSGRSELQVSVFSSNGQLVQILEEKTIVSNEKTYRFGEDMGSGVYYVRCHSKWGTEVKKLVIIN